MQDKFKEILDSLPEKPPLSRLEPYRELIDELRRRDRTFREIVQILAEKCGVKTSASTVHDFLRVPSPPKNMLKQRAVQSGAFRSRRLRDRAMPASVQIEESRADDDLVKQRIAALKLRRTGGASSGGFQFDPAEPLKIPAKSRDEKSGT